MLLAVPNISKHRKPKVNDCLWSLEGVLQYVCSLPDCNKRRLDLGIISSQEILINN